MINNSMVIKAAQVAAQELDDKELALINKHSLEPLAAEDVFTFKIAACDNAVDRDYEVFPLSTLKGLAKLYVGKTVIFDHLAKAENQCARIYAAEVVAGAGETPTGEAYSRLVLHCYMVRVESNKDLITEIKAGIKKEVSVGCAVESFICSICKTDKRQQWCEHIPGKQYENATCYVRLEKPQDAYEVSFVAIPAQKNAGTTKNYGAAPDNMAQAQAIAQRLRLAGAFIFTQKQEESAHE